MLQAIDLICGYNSTSKKYIWNESVNSHKLIFLIGPNGAGKTTFLKTLAGVIPAQSGSVIFHDKAVRLGLSMKERPAFLPTHVSVDEHLCGQDLLDIYGAHKSLIYANCEKLFELQNLLTQPMKYLSSGEQKRLLLTATLCHASDLLLLDEPLNSLDWKFIFALTDILQMEIQRGRSAIVSTHDFNWCLKFPEAVCWTMDQNIRVAAGPSSEALQSAEVQNLFNFKSQVTDNPLDGTKYLNIAPQK